MSQTQTLKQEIAELRLRIAELETQQEKDYAWSVGVLFAVAQMTSPLLIGHPRLKHIRDQMASLHARHQDVCDHPEQARKGAVDLSACSLLYSALADLWPDIDPDPLDAPPAAQRTPQA